MSKMLRKLLLICTLVLSWQSATLTLAVRFLANTSNINIESYLTMNKNAVGSSKLVSTDNNTFSEGLHPASAMNYRCGVNAHPVPLITFGRSMIYGEWPWHAMINYINDGGLYITCGGSLVTLNKVITAAHCLMVFNEDIFVQPEDLLITLGVFHLNWTDFHDRGIQIKRVNKITPHPQFGGMYYSNDIGIITLSENVKITYYVRPACLWDMSSDLHHIKHEIGTVVGNGVNENNGMTDYLRVGHLKYVPMYKCVVENVLYNWRLIGSKTFCAEPIKRTNVCKGDSGSGLFYRRGNRWLLRGVVGGGSVFKDTGRCNYINYSVFTDVAQHREFIIENWNLF